MYVADGDRVHRFNGPTQAYKNNDVVENVHFKNTFAAFRKKNVTLGKNLGERETSDIPKLDTLFGDVKLCDNNCEKKENETNEKTIFISTSSKGTGTGFTYTMRKSSKGDEDKDKEEDDDLRTTVNGIKIQRPF